jgi:hypothetical protein
MRELAVDDDAVSDPRNARSLRERPEQAIDLREGRFEFCDPLGISEQWRRDSVSCWRE